MFELQSRSDPNLDLNLRCADGADWGNGIRAVQVVQYNIRSANGRFPPRFKPSEHFDFSLEVAPKQRSTSTVGGFRLFVVDKPAPHAMKFAVFVVPCGRETDALFSTADGRNSLAEVVSAGRLIVCCMLPKNTELEPMSASIITLGDVTDLLTDAVLQFAPPGFLPDSDKAPYLTEAAPSHSGSPNLQKLGTMTVKRIEQLLRVTEINTSLPAKCRLLSGKQGKKPSTKETKSFKRLVESCGHLSCISQVCENHKSASNTISSCQLLPKDCELGQIKDVGAPRILQVGDDCSQLLSKLSNAMDAEALKKLNWSLFCLNEELASEPVKEMIMTTNKSPTCVLTEFNALSQSLLNAQDNESSFTAVIILLSCAFAKTIRSFIELHNHSVFSLAKLVLVRCCYEPSDELVQLEKELTLKKKDILKIDMNDTISQL